MINLTILSFNTNGTGKGVTESNANLPIVRMLLSSLIVTFSVRHGPAHRTSSDLLSILIHTLSATNSSST